MSCASVEAKPRYAAMVVDGHTGKVLHARNADSLRYPASLTKIMTLYVLFEFLKAGTVDYKTRFVVTPHAAAQAPSKLGLKAGQTIRVIDAIRALCTKSANDVAAVVAENLGGTVENFARIMTTTAREIGMKRTTFRNASGLPDKDQVTTARDMITLSRRILHDHPDYSRFFRTKYFKYRGRQYRNHNSLLFNYKGTEGIKTGYTRASGFNLTTSVRRKNKHLVAVVLGGKSARSRNAQMRALLNRAFPRAVARAPHRTRFAAAAHTASILPLPRRKPGARQPVPPAPIVTAQASTRAPYPASPQQGSREGFHVQVGAYKTRNDAHARLQEVGTRAGGLLRGYQPLTTEVPNPKRPLYRARFAGFTEVGARSACSKLKRLRIPCVVMRAE